MSNPMKYIKDLEAAGFERMQAEAQVQMVLDVLEGDLVTKSEFAIFQERIENRFVQFQQSIQILIDTKFSQLDPKFAQIESRFSQIDNRFSQIDTKFSQIENRFLLTDKKILESEFRLMTRLGFLIVSSMTIAVALLTWLIKI